MTKVTFEYHKNELAEYYECLCPNQVGTILRETPHKGDWIFFISWSSESIKDGDVLCEIGKKLNELTSNGESTK